MSSIILQSVVAITSQKDTDDLAYSVIATLAELVPLASAAIIHCSHGNVSLPLVHLEIKQHSNKTTYHWDQPTFELNRELVTKCLIDQKPVNQFNGSEDVHFFPISINDSFSTVLQINAKEDISEHYALVKGLLLIYKNYHSLLEESEHDKLTGLLNRNSFERRINRLARPRKPAQPDDKSHDSAWLAIVDIDYFKRINDSYGHVGGDEILLIIAQRMKSFFSNKSLLFRFGGEEFIIVLDKMKKEKAQALLEEFRQVVAEHSFPFDERLTISVGYCELATFDFPTTIIEYADKALYHAKETGRNKVYNYHELKVQGLLDTEMTDGDIELF